MFSSNHSGDQKYSQLGADSDSDSSGDHQDDFIQREIRNQKVRCVFGGMRYRVRWL